MTRAGKLSPRFYRFIQFFLWRILRFKFKVKVTGLENIPSSGGVIIASNHASYLDPPLMACPIKNRIVRFMARDTLFDHPVASWLFHRFGVVPLSRDRGDVGAIKTAIQLLKSGECVALFPEGTRTTSGELQAPKGGIGFLIAKAAVPVVPVYISGSYEAYPKGAKKIKSHPVSLHFGKTITPEELAITGPRGKPDFDAIGQLVMDRIANQKGSLLI